jgi:hypothetical protein
MQQEMPQDYVPKHGWRLAVPWGIFVVCLMACGCGRVSDAVPVAGIVLVDGKPLENVAVSFTPISGQAIPGPSSSGITDDQGRFVLKTVGDQRTAGAVPGKHRVTLNCRIPDLDKLPYAEGLERVSRANAILPSQARDGSLTFDIPPGGTTGADFKFTSPFPR